MTSLSPQPLVESLADIESRIRAAPRILLLLDCDATIASCVQPDGVTVDSAARRVLARLSLSDHMTVALISGRSLEDLQGRVGFLDMVYASNHGLEILVRQLRFVEPTATERREELRQLCEELATRFRDVVGASVEYKNLTASVHYRGVAAEDVPDIERAVAAAIAPRLTRFRMLAGENVFDILPRTAWNRATAVKWIYSHLAGDTMLAIFIGDGSAGENAFQALPDSVTVKVARSGPTQAKYFVGSPDDVLVFLFWLESVVSARNSVNCQRFAR